MSCREIRQSIAPVKRTRHALYDAKYHLVCIPKYGKEIFSEAYASTLKGIFYEISEHYEFEIDAMGVI